jgi:hypothetical protein
MQWRYCASAILSDRTAHAEYHQHAAGTAAALKIPARFWNEQTDVEHRTSLDSRLTAML